MDNASLENNQNLPKKRGGPRPGSGRPKGSVNKITAEEFFNTFRKQTGKEYLTEMVKRISGAYDLIAQASTLEEKHEALATAHKYDSLVAKYIFTDIQQVDHTSNGESLGVQLIFKPQELDDWKPDNN